MGGQPDVHARAREVQAFVGALEGAGASERQCYMAQRRRYSLRKPSPTRTEIRQRVILIDGQPHGGAHDPGANPWVVATRQVVQYC